MTTLNIPDWHFDLVTRPSSTLDPNLWTIERANGYAAIFNEHGKLIDELSDTGQTDLDLIIHAIGWTHAHFIDPNDHE